MSNHRNPRPSLSRPFPDKFDPTASRDRAACTEADIEAIRYEVARADVLADAAMQAFDITVWGEVDDARIDHVSHLVSAASEASSAALLAVDDLRRAMERRTVTAETITDDELCALRDEAIEAGDDGTRNIACGALNAVDEFQGFACRQACAAVLNAKRSGTKQVETGWGRFTIVAVLLALLGVLSLLVLGACQVNTAAGATVIHTRGGAS